MPPRMKVRMKRGREGEDAAGGVKQEPDDAEAKRAKKEPPESVAEVEGGLKLKMKRGDAHSPLRTRGKNYPPRGDRGTLPQSARLYPNVIRIPTRVRFSHTV